LGWSDYRLTNYSSIERWWEIVFSAYLLVSLQASNFQLLAAHPVKSQPQHPAAPSQLDTSQLTLPWKQHPWWENGMTQEKFPQQFKIAHSTLYFLLFNLSLVRGVSHSWLARKVLRINPINR